MSSPSTESLVSETSGKEPSAEPPVSGDSSAITRGDHNQRLLWLARHGDLLKFKTVFEESATKPDLEWRGCLDPDNAHLDTPVRVIDCACLWGHQDIVIYLLGQGADPRSQVEPGQTFFHYAVGHGAERVVEAILNTQDSPAELLALKFPTERTTTQWPLSPLELAAQRGHIDVVRVLINHGASPRQTTAIPDALSRGHLQLAMLLIEQSTFSELSTHYVPLLNTAINSSWDSRDNQAKLLDVVNLLLGKGLDPCELDGNGKTAWDSAYDKELASVLGLLAQREVLRRYTPREDCFGPETSFIRVHKKVVPAAFDLPDYFWDDSDGISAVDSPYRIRHDLEERDYPHWHHNWANNMTWVLGCAMAMADVIFHQYQDSKIDQDKVKRRNLEFKNGLFNALDRHFVQVQADTDVLISREPGVGFEDIALRYTPRSDKNSHIRRARVNFGSFAIPFLWVYNESVLDQDLLLATGPSPEGLKFCATTRRQTLRECFPRSLDEHTNPGLTRSALKPRNEDQVLSRYTSKRSCRSILTVCQAWAWRIGEDGLITAFEQEFMDLGEVSLLVEHPNGRKDISADHLLGIMFADLVDSLDRPRIAGGQEPIFNIFAKVIAAISEEVNVYVEINDISSINMDDEKRFLHEISDVREELSMMKRVLSQQEEIWREFAYYTWPDPDNWEDGRSGRFRPVSPAVAGMKDVWQRIEKPQHQFVKYKRRIGELEEDAERVERSIQVRLDLKQKHLTLQETHSMTVMSASVFAFTIITIVFTPLSFAASLFALPVDQFSRHQTMSDTDDPVYRSSYIAKWLVTVEVSALVITAGTMLVALKYFLKVDMSEGFLRQIRALSSGKPSSTSYRLYDVLTSVKAVLSMVGKPRSTTPQRSAVGDPKSSNRDSPSDQRSTVAGLQKESSGIRGLLHRVRGNKGEKSTSTGAGNNDEYNGQNV